MQADPQQLVDNGYIIIKECIPSHQLDELRNSFEELVERQKSIWAREQTSTGPPGGVWETSGQPRLSSAHLLIQQQLMQLSFAYMKTLGALVPR